MKENPDSNPQALTIAMVASAMGRGLSFDLIPIHRMEIYQELANFSEIAVQVYGAMNALGFDTDLEEYILAVIEPFSVTLSQQWAMGTYNYASCKIQLGKDLFLFYDAVGECDTDEVEVIERYTDFVMTQYHPHIAVKVELAGVTFH